MKNFSAMASNPTFPFYANDYLVDTIRWSRAMQGLHISLIAESWANGGLHDDNGAPAGLGSTDVELWLKIKHKWKLVDGLWINEKLEKSRRERIAFVEKQREKGLLSAEQRKNKSTKSQPEPSHGSTGVEPIEDEDEKENDIELKLKESLDEIYLDQQKIKWPHLDFDFEYRTFCEKVRGSPDRYQGRDTSGIRLAFQSQLRYAKKKPNATTPTDKATAHIHGLMAGVQRRNGSKPEGG